MRSMLVPVAAAWLTAGADLDCAAADRAAMITDLEGAVELTTTGAAREAEILDDLGSDATLAVGSGARVTLVYPGSGREYDITGRARLAVGSEQPRMLEGAAPAVRDLALPRATGLQTTGRGSVAETTVRMRSVARAPSLQLIAPAGTVLVPPGEFSWEAPPGMNGFEFDLSEAGGDSLFTAHVDGTRLELPAAVRLRAGADYRWRVRARTASGRPALDKARFRIADDLLRREVERARERAGSSVSARVVLAAWLENEGLEAEARTIWRALAAERPAAAALRARAGQP